MWDFYSLYEYRKHGDGGKNSKKLDRYIMNNSRQESNNLNPLHPASLNFPSTYSTAFPK
jgi:hypothetical protein